MAQRFVEDSGEEVFGSDESDEDVEFEEYEPEPEDEYKSDDSDVILTIQPIYRQTRHQFYCCRKMVQYSYDPPPLGRPVGRSSFSNKGWIIEPYIIFNV